MELGLEVFREKKKRYASITQAKLERVREGLHLAAQIGIDSLMVECDSMTVVPLLQNSDVAFHAYGQLIKDCRALMQSFGRCFLKHVWREANSMEDCLADLGHSFSCNFYV